MNTLSGIGTSRSVSIGVLPSFMVRLSLVLLWALIVLLSLTSRATGQEPETGSVLELSLDELLNVEITSVSKKTQKRSEAAAAIYVLTSEDIRRSGATTIPDVLRTVPGLNVAKIDANRWSVTARGFGGRFANKLLVLIDGRSIYTPFFSGVYWEMRDVMLEDVDRIEIIRGPGGALWGANAVNGVINIVTKATADTQGGLVTAGGGTEERAFGAVRYGGKVGKLGHYRVYGKYFLRDQGGDFVENGLGPPGGKANDDWNGGRIGFRMDLDLSGDDQLTVQGDVFQSAAGVTYDITSFTAPNVSRVNSTSDYSGGNILARWTRALADDSELQLQFYYDFYRTDDMIIDEQRHTLDFDFQHRFQAGDRHDIMWGLNYRVTLDDFESNEVFSVSPKQRNDQLFSAFVQDEIKLHDTLRLTVGTKIERNDYTHFEIQPSARVAWTPNDRNTLWGAVSRAVRTPSRSESDMRLLFAPVTGSPGEFVVVFGSNNFKSEELLAFELGYRTQVADKVAFDLALFFNDYDNLRFALAGTSFAEPTPAPAHTVLPFTVTNGSDATTYGLEIAMDYGPTPWWLIRSSYSFIKMNISNPQAGSAAEDTPQQQFSVQNRFDLPHGIEFDTTLRYVDRLSTPGIGSYLDLDARVAWHPREDIEIAIVGQNLLNSEKAEFVSTIIPAIPTRTQRGVYGKVTWRF